MLKSHIHFRHVGLNFALAWSYHRTRSLARICHGGNLGRNESLAKLIALGLLAGFLRRRVRFRHLRMMLRVLLKMRGELAEGFFCRGMGFSRVAEPAIRFKFSEGVRQFGEFCTDL